MPEPHFVQVTYIVATPQRVWEALTTPETTLQFFGERFESDWTTGAAFRSFGGDGRPASEGRVVESDPPRRLALTWERAAGRSGKMRDMPRAVAAYLVEPLGDVVRVTVSESHEEPVDLDYLSGGRRGWPIVMSRLKTLLETGKPMPPIPRG